MIDKLEAIRHRFEEVSQLIVQPDAMADMKNYSRLSKEYKELEKIVKQYEAYQEVLSNIKNAKEILEEQIAFNFGLNEGQAQIALTRDNAVVKAQQVLSNTVEYTNLLSPR